MSILFFLFVSFLAYVFFYVINYLFIIPLRFRRFYQAQGLKGTPFIPLFGDILLLRKYVKADRNFYFFEDLFKKYNSNIIYHSFGPMFRILLGDPVAVASALSAKNSSHFNKSRLMKRSLRDVIGEYNLLLLDGPLHKIHRKLLSPMFHFANLKSMINGMWDVADKMMEVLEKGSKNNQTKYNTIDHSEQLLKGEEVEIEMPSFFNQLALELAIYFVFGGSFYAEGSSGLPEGSMDIIHKSLSESVGLIQRRALTMVSIIPILNALPLPSKRLIEHWNANMDNLVNTVIKNRIEGKTKSQCDGPDLLDLLIRTTKENFDEKVNGKKINNNGEEQDDPQTKKAKAEHDLLTIKEISDEAKTFIFAGHETTANLLNWISYSLSTHPDIQARLQKEVDAVLAKNGGRITDKCLGELVFLDAVIQETLRVFPPAAALVRVVTEDCTIERSDGEPLLIKAGTDVVISVKQMHMSKEIWGEDAEQFNPDRWMKGRDRGMSDIKRMDEAVDGKIDDHHSSHDSKEKRRPAGAFIPFSLGQRSCIGQHFALNEAKIAVASMISRYELRLVPGQKIVPEIKVTLRPKYGLKIFIKKRHLQNK